MQHVKIRKALAKGALALAALCCHQAPLRAQPGPAGLVSPVVLPAFDEHAPVCAAPPGLKRELAFAQDNDRQFMQGVARGLAAAAQDRGLAFRAAVAANDAQKMIEQVREFGDAKVGAVIAAPVDPMSLARSLQEVIWAGGYVGTVVPPPATTILNAPQYLTGKVLGDAAAAYIRKELGGKANVVLLTHDSLQFLAPRFVAMRDSLRGMPDVTIVADISPLTVNEAGGFAMMQTVLLANPKVDVVLGADTVVLGALAALRAANKVHPKQFLGGIDGEPQAVAEIKAGGPYKTTVSLNSPVFGYALGNNAADWLEGKSVPQAMDILPKLLTAQNMPGYEADLASPGDVFKDPARRASYLKMYGNICYDTRDRYLNFPWSSERK